MHDIILLLYKWIWFAVLIASMGGSIYLFSKLLYMSYKGKDSQISYASKFYDKNDACFKLKPTQNELKDILMLVGIYIIFRLFTFAFSFFIMEMFETGYSFEFSLDHILYQFTKWDAHHYINIADHWYVSEDAYNLSPELFAEKEYVFIAFYPLYPIIVRLFSFICPNITLSAHIVSNIFIMLSIAAMYKLVKIDYSRKTAITVSLMLVFSPYGFFFSLAFTESLFLFLTLMFFIMLRKEKYVYAGIFGLLSALTKNFGLLLIIPYGVRIIELACKKHYSLLQILKKLLPGAMILAGFGIYLCINKAVSGEWFKFMTYQNEHWNQRISCPWENVVNHMMWFLGESDVMANKWFIWFGDISSVCFAMGVCWAGRKKIPFMYSIYSLAYIFLTLTVSWLLSGPRYLLVNFPTYIVLGRLCENKKWLTVLIIVAEIIIGTVCTVGYMTNSNIM